MDAAPFIRLIDDFTNLARAIAPGLAALGFVASALQLLITYARVATRASYASSAPPQAGQHAFPRPHGPPARGASCTGRTTRELGKAGMIGSVVGLVAVFFAPQIMTTVHSAFGS